jgi:hypothetical protein
MAPALQCCPGAIFSAVDFSAQVKSDGGARDERGLSRQVFQHVSLRFYLARAAQSLP